MSAGNSRALVLVSGSWRRGSLTTAVLRRVEQLARATPGVRCSRLAPQTLPHFDADLEATPPAAARWAADLVSRSDALVIVTPEYNGGPPGSLLNLLDWLSRPWQQSPLTGRSVVTISCGPGASGARAAHDRLRESLQHAGACVVGRPLCVPHADALWSGAADRRRQLDEDLRELLAHGLSELAVASRP